MLIKVLIVLLMLSASANVAAAFCNAAALLQHSGSQWADVVGLGGIAIAVACWIGGSVFLCRQVD